LKFFVMSGNGCKTSGNGRLMSGNARGEKGDFICLAAGRKSSAFFIFPSQPCSNQS